MRSVLLALGGSMLPGDDSSSAKGHTYWRDHWRARSTVGTDDFASLAWFHAYQLDPVSAIKEWQSLADHELQERHMAVYLSLLQWPEMVLTGRHGAARQRTLRSFHYCCPTQKVFKMPHWGSVGENLARAIECYEAALSVYTKKDFPTAWTTTQNNLGIAYGNLPTGNRSENLARAIAYYGAALTVRTQEDFPTDWAMTQNNLGIAYCKSTDRGSK